MSRVRFCTLVSGSSANSSYLEINGRGILIDAGAGIRKTEKLLSQLGSSLSRIQGIFLTHEHSDHGNGLCSITRKYRIPIMANGPTLTAVAAQYPELDTDLFRLMPTGAKAQRDDFCVTSFRCMHDSAECVGYRIDTEQGSFGVCTDLGDVSDTVVQALRKCRGIIFEANHDADMLRSGPYSYPLKQRIAGPCGHLSNLQCGQALCGLTETGIEQVFLAHLSRENNTPQVCMHTVRAVLEQQGIREGTDVKAVVAPRNEPSEMYIC